MNREIQSIIENSDSYALATVGEGGVNVVPISVVTIEGDEIFLYDFFMKRTADNILLEPRVAFIGWKEFVGVQVKATAVYENTGDIFETAVTQMKQRFPDRTLKALIRLTPTAIYDVAPSADSTVQLDK